MFRLLPRGFANRDLRPILAQLLGVPAESITPGKMTYDLRRLRQHGLIERIPHTFRYQVTDTGLAQALFLTRLHDRFLRTGLASLAAPAASEPRPGSRHPRLHQPPSTTSPASRPRRLTCPQPPAHYPDLQHPGLRLRIKEPGSPKQLRSARDFAREEWPLRGQCG